MSFNYALTRSDTGLQRRDDGNYYRASANEPIGVIGSDGKPIGAWIPKEITNLALRSEQLDNATWIKTPTGADTFQGTGLQAVVTANYAQAIDGSVTADRVQLDLGGGTTSSDRSGFYQSLTVINGNPYSASIFIKLLDANDIADVNILVIAGLSGTVEKIALTNGWYFYRIKGTSSTTNIRFRVQSSGGTSADTIDCLVWGAMFVSGSVDLNPYDYLTTTTASVARQVTDIRNVAFPEIANIQGFVDLDLSLSNSPRRIIKIGADDNNNLFINLTAAEVVELGYIIGGVVQWSIASSSLSAGRYRIAYFVSSGLNILWIDNIEIGRNTDTYTPQGTIKAIGGNLSGTSNKLSDCGIILEYYNSGLSETEIENIALDYSMYGGSSAFKGV